MNAPTVGIVIVNWNTGDLLRRCLESLEQLPERNLIRGVAVVDNASSDESLRAARAAVAGAVPITFVELDTNIGFSRGNNRGILELEKEGSNHHILLLNPDTEMLPGAIEQMLKRLSTRERAGVVGPMLLEADGTVQPSVRRLPTTSVLAAMYLRLYWFWPNLPVWQRYLAHDFVYDREQVVEQVMGAAFLIRREVYAELGGLDERFSPYWFEEVDYCARVRAAGWDVVYAPAARIRHFGGVSFGQVVGWRKSWPWLANAWRYAHKHLGWGAVMALTVLLPVALLLAAIGMVRHTQSR